EFEASKITTISIQGSHLVGDWVFNPGASQYIFEIGFSADLTLINGITINAGSVHIFNFGTLGFDHGSSSAAYIDNLSFVTFTESSSAGVATIRTYGGGGFVSFARNSTGDSAQLITDAGGIVDFSFSKGPDGHGHLSAGSIAGAGTYRLGA